MKKEQKQNKKLLKAAASAMIKRERMGWPPDCGGLIYQPMRPARCEAGKKDR